MLPIFLLIVFIFSAFAILHTYIFYPLIMQFLRNCFRKNVALPNNKEQPTVAIIMAAYNEERVIEKKLKSCMNSTYPSDKLQIHIGSDNSQDKTNEIVTAYEQKIQNLHFTAHKERQGKIKIMNKLAQEANAEWLIFTDANIFFAPETFSELMRWHNDPQVAMVCGHINKMKHGQNGSAEAELLYMNNENNLKLNESLLLGFCLGAEGGCFAIRKSFFEQVPELFLNDDFYTTLSVIEQKGKIIYAENAICFEDTTDTEMEFKRKVRIQKGNIQNLVHYWYLVLNPFKSLTWALWSHKIFRWMTPFLLIINAISSVLLTAYYPYAWLLTLPVIGFFAYPLIYGLLQKIGIKSNFLSALYHFVMMNYAFIKGVHLYFSGPKTSIWERTQRKA